MDITVSRRHVELSESLRAVAVEKIGRLERFLEGMDRAEVHFYEERNPRITDKDVCEVTIEGHGHHVRARVAAADPFAAVEKVADKLEQQLHRLKTKLVGRSHPRRVPATTPAATADGLAPPLDTEPEVEPDDGLRIVRTKRFQMKPMTPDEAALHLELTDHSFYFFANAETGRSAVVYRRTAGDLGLIEDAG